MKNAIILLLNFPGLVRAYGLLFKDELRPHRYEAGWFACVEILIVLLAIFAGIFVLLAYHGPTECRIHPGVDNCIAQLEYPAGTWQAIACWLLFAVSYVSSLVLVILLGGWRCQPHSYVLRR